MNKEEIIKILKMITPADLLNCWDNGAKEYEAINGMLELYNKEVEKNKELENDNQVLRETLYGGNVGE